MPLKEVIEQISFAKANGNNELVISDSILEELPKELFSLKSLKKLEITLPNLNHLPPDIGNLSELQSLEISNSKLSSVPQAISKLEKLKKLRIINNSERAGLRFFPKNLENLSSLEELVLIGHKISVIPQRIKSLKKLTYLNLARNKIRELPKFLEEFTSLQTLWLYNNSITEIPEFVFDLSKIEWISIAKNPLMAFPSKIAKLANVDTLYASDLQLSEIPPEIFSLTKLRSLNLGENNLTTIPPDIKKLKLLDTLRLSNNKLNNIPREIGLLNNLRFLRLDGNQLDYLPQEIGNLSLLEELDLAFNRLYYLPSSIQKLDNLYNKENFDIRRPLDLNGNFFQLPEEVLKKNPRDLIRYIIDLQTATDKKPLLEAKLIFIGSGAVGKTSLINTLLTGSKGDPEKTVGIEIKDWTVKRGSEDIKVHIWDFGGQEIMHATHKFFMTKRSAYVLVISPRVEDKYGFSELEYWLKLIKSYASDVPIVIVINKCETHRIDIAKGELSDKYKNIVGFVETSCDQKIGIPELQNLIAEAILKLNHLNIQLPYSYFQIKQVLAQKNRDYISYTEYEDICKSIDPTFKEESMITLIGILHDLGVMLNFRDEQRISLKETQVLNPKWVTYGVYEIINSGELVRKKGILNFLEISDILKSVGYEKTVERKYIIDMMERFELCYNVGEVSGSYFIPGAFPKDRPEISWHYSTEELLNFHLQYDVMPSSIMSRFIVKIHPFIRGHEFWRNGVVMSKDNCFALIKSDPEEKAITLQISGPGNRRDLLSFIRGQFDTIHSTLQGITVKRKVPVSKDGKSVLLDYDYLLYYEEKGQETILVPELDEELEVSQLLNGIESQLTRSERRTQKLLEKILAKEFFNQEISKKVDRGKKILFLSSNPLNTDRLRVDEEIREIKECLKRSNFRQNYSIYHSTAVRPMDLRRDLLDQNPEFLHFSGHGVNQSSGSIEGIILEDNNGEATLVTAKALSGLLKNFKNSVKCVILNSCYSEFQAKEIVKHIQFVIGMKVSINDKSAIIFSTSFYDSIGAGKGIIESFEIARASILLEGLSNGDVPILLQRNPGSN